MLGTVALLSCAITEERNMSAIGICGPSVWYVVSNLPLQRRRLKCCAFCLQYPSQDTGTDGSSPWLLFDSPNVRGNRKYHQSSRHSAHHHIVILTPTDVGSWWVTPFSIRAIRAIHSGYLKHSSCLSYLYKWGDRYLATHRARVIKMQAYTSR
jgi:hypothetical protein